MEQQVITTLTIDSDTSGADQFAQSMDKAGASAERGSSSVQSMSLAIAGVSVASIAALAALRGFVDFVGSQTQALVDMADRAQLAGFSVREFQETLFAARAKGLTEKDFVTGLDRIGADFVAASRGVTEFGKLFEANGISIRKANRELKTARDGVADLAGLVQNASPQIQQAIARIAGVSASWVPFLRQGVEGIEALKKTSAGLGVIIDDDMIAKARDFNDQWKLAIATWDLQFKASLASILPLLIKLANLASTVIDAVGAVTGTLGRWLTPDDSKSPAQIKDQIAAANDLIRRMERFEEQSFRVQSGKGALNLPEDADIQRVRQYIAQLQIAYSEKKLARVPVYGSGTVLPPANDNNDAVDRALLTLSRHTEAQKADAAAIGLGARAHAELRVEAAMTSAILANGGKITEAQTNAFLMLKFAAGAAADALERARVASAIKFGRDTAIFSQEDVQIASQLRGI